MDYHLNFPPPYLCRKNLADRVIIDKKIQAELKRIRLLLPANQAKVKIQGNINLKDTSLHPHDTDIKSTEAKISLDLKKQFTVIATPMEKLAAPIQLKAFTKIDAAAAPNSQRTASDTVTNSPAGTSTIGYNCTIAYTTTLDFEAFSGSYSSSVWYVVFEDIGGLYDYESDGYPLGDIITIKKPPFKSKAIGTWTMHFDMYAKCTYPTTRFKVVVVEYKDGKLSDTISSDVITINFNGNNCINIHDMGLIASNDNGGYPAIKGGDHGTQPTLYVNLNSPAPPDGQNIYLGVTVPTNANPEAWINDGMGQVRIDGGQTHGEWSDFLGSRHVSGTKDIHVKAAVNGVEGVSTLRITKK